MGETGAAPSTYGRDPSPRRTEIAIGENSLMTPFRPEPVPERDDVLHSGIWLPPNYYSGPKNTVIRKTWRESALQLDYTKVAEDLYAFPSEYKLAIPTEGSKVTDCPT